MPLWEYECVNKDCKHTVECVIITNEDRKNCQRFLFIGPYLQPCPKCGHEMERIMSVPAKGIVK